MRIALRRPDLLASENEEAIWETFCGFFDLTAGEFQAVQNELLHQSLNRLAGSPIARDMLPGMKPWEVEEFRTRVPLTTYSDYASYFEDRSETAINETPGYWACAAFPSGTVKWVPYTSDAMERLLHSAIAALIQASARTRGEVNLRGDERILDCSDSPPSLAGLILELLTERAGFRVVPPPGTTRGLNLNQKIEMGLRLGLSRGLDIVCTSPGVLVTIGQSVQNPDIAEKSLSELWPSGQVYRRLKALYLSKWQKRQVLPGEIWQPKALLTWGPGPDTGVNHPEIARYWGKKPAEMYVCTEAGILGLQAFNHKGTTLLPYAAFFEFIPEGEETLDREDDVYQPRTLLLGELEAGKQYEVVLTSFYGMPFLRYRVGHLIKVLPPEGQELQASLPRIAFAGYTGKADSRDRK